jgi:hypothetical protein
LKVGLPRVPAADVAVRFLILCACHLVLLVHTLSDSLYH